MTKNEKVNVTVPWLVMGIGACLAAATYTWGYLSATKEAPQ